MRPKSVVRVVLVAGALVAVGSVLRRVRAGRKVEMSGADDGPAGEDHLEVVEVETEGVDDDGNLVIDDLVVAVDSSGTVVASDETVAVVTSDGDAVVDEILSVVGEDGELHAVEEEIAVIESEDQ